MAPRVTALREERGGKVRVELDGAAWRTLPAAAVVRAQLLVGSELDRPRARELRRALRRAEAVELAARALARSDRSRAALAAHLEQRGVPSAERDVAVKALEEAKIVDDDRFAVARAASLARRGFGDAAIVFELERQGISRERIAAALETVAPEHDRAAAIVARAGATAKTARRLAAKGFSEDAIDSALGGIDDPL